MFCCVIFEAKARVYCAREVRIDGWMEINIGGRSNELMDGYKNRFTINLIEWIEIDLISL